MSRSLLRSALELRSPVTRLPPTFLLPIRARWISSTSPASVETVTTASAQPPPPPSLKSSRSQQTSAAIHAKTAAASAAAAASPSKPRPTSRTAPSEPSPPPTGPIPESVRQLLPLLRSQPAHYITVHINGRPYLVTPGDSVRLPFLMPGVSPGDVLRLNRASVLGSRDFTLRPGNPTARKPGSNEVAYIDERLFECRATVVGVDSEPMRIKEKTKRRNRRVRMVKSKHRYTVLRISELRIKSPAEVDE